MPMREATRCEPLENVFSGETGYYRDAPHRDLLPRLIRIAPSLAVEDKILVQEECYDDRLLSWIVQGLYRSCLRRVAVRKNQFRADRRFLDEILHAFLSLQRTMARIEAGELEVPDDAWRTYSDVHEIVAAYLGLAGYRQARRALLDTMWTMARQPGDTGSAIGRRAFGLAMLAPTDWPKNSSELVPEDSSELVPPDMLIVADCSADRVLLRGVAEPRREIHDDGIDNDRAGLHRIPPGSTLDRSIRQSLAEPLPTPGAVVFPLSILDSIGKSENKRETKSLLGDVLGRKLPLVPVPEDWDAWERDRLQAFPWAFRAIRAFRTAQAGRTHFVLTVLLLHGSPGCGKSALARELAESCGLKFTRYQADASSENSYAGTTVRWQSGHLGILEAAIASAKVATVCVSIDEIEKSSGSRRSNGGTLHDCLHGTWELETARAWTSPFLLHPVDVSHTVYVCTANEKAGIPASLRDRMTLVEVPEPSAEHLSVLAPRIARELCRQRGLDEGWAAFDSVEWTALEAWKGGSIRTLQTCIETVFRVRDELPLAARGPLN